MRLLAFTPLICSALVFGACSESGSSDKPDNFGYDGKTGIEFSVSPLTLNATTDGCYSFAVVSGLNQYVVGRGPSAIAANLPNTVTGAPGVNTPADGICGSRFGQGAEVSYVAPCDASALAKTHTVHLWIEDLCTSGTAATNDCVANTTFQNPCPVSGGCSLQVECVENADTPVTFNFTIMDSASQGFFDVAVNFENIFCSAKLDTCYNVGEANETPIELLFDEDGRIPTAVLAFACTAGTDTDSGTFLHTSNVLVNCNGQLTTLNLNTVTQEGNQTQAGNQTPDNGLIWAAYFGSEALESNGDPANKEYFNVAVAGLGNGCKLNWTATASDGSMMGSTGAVGATLNNYPIVEFGPVAVTDDNGVWLCSENPVNEPGSGVVTTPVDCAFPADCVSEPCTTWQAGSGELCEAGSVLPIEGCNPADDGVTITLTDSNSSFFLSPTTDGTYLWNIQGIDITPPPPSQLIFEVYLTSTNNVWDLWVNTPGTDPTIFATNTSSDVLASWPGTVTVVCGGVPQPTGCLTYEVDGNTYQSSMVFTAFSTSVYYWGPLMGDQFAFVFSGGTWSLIEPGTPPITTPLGNGPGGNIPPSYTSGGDIPYTVSLTSTPCPPPPPNP